MLSLLFLYSVSLFLFSLLCGVSTQQDLHRWPCSVMASLHPQSKSTVRGRWVKHLAGSSILLCEQHRALTERMYSGDCNAVGVPCIKPCSPLFLRGAPGLIWGNSSLSYENATAATSLQRFRKQLDRPLEEKASTSQICFSPIQFPWHPLWASG